MQNEKIVGGERNGCMRKIPRRLIDKVKLNAHDGITALVSSINPISCTS
jgi:hypothetical protein